MHELCIHVYRRGTVASIAEQYQITPELLIEINELPNPDNLVIGQSLAIRIPETVHTVVAGDSLFAIAQQYEVDANKILQNNPRIAATEALNPGDTLVITFADEEPYEVWLLDMPIHLLIVPF